MERGKRGAADGHGTYRNPQGEACSGMWVNDCFQGAAALIRSEFHNVRRDVFDGQVTGATETTVPRHCLY